MNTGQIATQLRHRQHQLGNLEPGERISRLSMELNELWKGMSSAEKLSTIEDLERVLPVGIDDSADRNAKNPKPAAALFAPETLSLDDLLPLLRNRLDAMDPLDRAEAQAKVASALRLNVASSAPPVSAPEGEIPREKILKALEEIKMLALKDPDRLLNSKLKVFSKSDIKNLVPFIGKLRRPTNELTEYFSKKFSPRTKELITHFSPKLSDLEEIENALEQDFEQLLSEECLYNERRFAGVTLTLEATRLLQRSATLEGRQMERLNQCLMESAFPEEICFQTCEREILERIILSLNQKTQATLPVERVIGLAAACLRELACVEQFARIILLSFDSRVFDQPFGRIILEPRNDLNQVIQDYLSHGDEEKFSSDLRDWTGLIKSLLNWYSYSASLGTKIGPLNHKNFFDPDKGQSKTYLGDLPFKIWEQYAARFDLIRQDLFNSAGMQGTRGALTEEVWRDVISKIIESRVITTLGVIYNWNVR